MTAGNATDFPRTHSRHPRTCTHRLWIELRKTKMNAPQQAFAAFQAAKPPATKRGRERQAILVKELNRTRTRYERIGKHEWARKRVCSILRLVRYDQWNGFVPPGTDQNGNPNRTTERRLLIALLREVEQFEADGTLPDYATEVEPA